MAQETPSPLLQWHSDRWILTRKEFCSMCTANACMFRSITKNHLSRHNNPCAVVHLSWVASLTRQRTLSPLEGPASTEYAAKYKFVHHWNQHLELLLLCVYPMLPTGPHDAQERHHRDCFERPSLSQTKQNAAQHPG